MDRWEMVYLTVDGKRLEAGWVNQKAPANTTLIFLHEGLGSISLWRDFPYELAKQCNCRGFVYSRFGYGESDPCPLPRPVRFMHDEGLRVLPAIIKQAGIHDYILMGHSDGGSIALIHAGKAAGPNLRGVITEAAHVSCEPFNIAAIQLARQNYLTTDLRRKLKRYHGDNVDTAFWGWNDVWLHPEFIYWNIEAFLTKIRVPVLALQGDKDNYGTSAQVESIVRNAGAGAEMKILSDCGHSPHRDRPDAVIQASKAFILNLIHPTG